MTTKLCFAALLFLTMITFAGCDGSDGTTVPLDLPRGVLARLEVTIDGDIYGFGPFVGYYFRPLEPGNFERLGVWCYNERRFYSSNMPENALLFTGEARLVSLMPKPEAMPHSNDRINPVFFKESPAVWLKSRPRPQAEFIHFHSMYNRAGSSLHGYWIRHHGEANFTYDMGGRVVEGSPLYHKVSKGVDLEFARIIEFDSGP